MSDLKKNVFVSKRASFQAGSILTQPMLQEMYDFPQRLADFSYRLAEYGEENCILAGMDLELKDGKIYFQPGICLLGGKLYFSAEPLCITLSDSAELKGKFYYVILQQKTGAEWLGVQEDALEAIDVSESNLPTAEDKCIKLLRVSRNYGALVLPQLKMQAENPFEEFTSSLPCGLLDIPYGCNGKTTYHPYIFKAVKAFLEQKKHKCMQDYALLLHLQNNPVVSMESVVFFINDAGIECDLAASREDIFVKFSQALLMVRQIAAVVHDKVNEAEQSEKTSEPDMGFFVN